jgi:hypothetical protein
MWCSGSYKHIYLRGRGFESPRSLFFNVGMRIDFVREGTRKTRDSRK